MGSQAVEQETVNMYKVIAVVVGIFVGQMLARPEGYEYGEGRTITDEALRKFYYDLYDQENDNHDNHDRHQIDIDDYFDDALGTVGKEKLKDEEKPLSKFGKANVNKTPKNTKAIRKNPALKSVNKQAETSLPPAQTQVPAVDAASSSRDPTFVLSRLLFHLSQLPQ